MNIKETIKNSVPKEILGMWRIFRLKTTAKLRLAGRKMLRFDIHLTDHCNLNCKGCQHFSPLSPEIYLDMDILNRDCARLSELTGGRVELISVLGGEPLLHPHITECLDILRKYFPFNRISILTNGLLLQKQPETFWNKCKTNKIDIIVSLYPVSLDVTKIQELGDLHGILIEFWGNPVTSKRSWIRQTLDLNGKQNIARSHSVCGLADHCIQLVNGKLYQCATTAYIKYFNAYFDKKLELTEKDYIDIYETKDINDLLNFYNKPTPFCKYCKTKSVKYDEWGKSSRNMDEWV